MPPGPRERTPRSDRFEHDRKLDGAYTFDRRGYDNLTIIAWVSVHLDELADEFVRQLTLWDDKPEVRLIRWEAERFGSQLEDAAHRMLWAAVRRHMHAAEQRGSTP